MAEEKKEAKPVKSKNPRPKENKEVVKTPVTKPLVDWSKVEATLVQKFIDSSWTAERHRANPTHTVGVVISTVMPEVLKLLR